MTPTETAQVLTVLGAAFPHISITPETVEVYHQALADIDGSTCRDAVRDMLLTIDRWPAPATIRRCVAERSGALAPDPGSAWGMVLDEARRIGLNDSPEFAHAAIRRTVRLLGWRNICTSESPDTIRAHFLRIYEAQARLVDNMTLTADLGHLTTTGHKEITP